MGGYFVKSDRMYKETDHVFIDFLYLLDILAILEFLHEC